MSLRITAPRLRTFRTRRRAILATSNRSPPADMGMRYHLGSAGSTARTSGYDAGVDARAVDLERAEPREAQLREVLAEKLFQAGLGEEVHVGRLEQHGRRTVAALD